MIFTLWSPSVIYVCFQFYQKQYPNEPFRVHYERAIYSESILNGLLCTYYGIFYQDNAIDTIVLSHILSDFLAKLTHHIMSHIASGRSTNPNGVFIDSDAQRFESDMSTMNRRTNDVSRIVYEILRFIP